MSVKLLTEQHLEFLSLKGGCTGSSVSTLVKMPHCWKSRVTAHLQFDFVTVAGAASSDDERKNEREELKPQLQHDQDNLVTNLEWVHLNKPLLNTDLCQKNYVFKSHHVFRG